ncbi:hypothetical protein [Pandoraea pulmonicola]|uniref:DUF3630 family protein n=1 Tax=Pandoraea pulmonicola TaxID=93221 RepID=A0ABM5RYF6_PANPU|nr:hypothetical protein [Pandoraea pulmonicola]AJC20518.1 hypothetical protein RO07_08590 [Pandoraea pulmonicola]
MEISLETSPTGFRYIAVLRPVDWERAPRIVAEILSLLDASEVTTIANDDAISVDTKWWNFTFNGKRFRIVYEEWPKGLSIEPIETVDLQILLEISQKLLAA